MSFDFLGRRLITGGRDGSVRIWNHNNGELLQELIKNDNTEVTGICYIPVKETTYIAVTGWDRKVSLFRDNPKSSRLIPEHTWSMQTQSPWHTDDIISMAFCAPNFLVTGSYNGVIIVCNLHSGNVISEFRPDINNELDSGEKKSIDQRNNYIN
jgi:WD40 repeat protein